MRRTFVFALVVLAAATAAAPANARWRPAVGVSWQWQLSGHLDLSVQVPVYDVDGFETRARTVSRLHSLGRHVVCYINAGAWEDWRPDADRFPSEVLGEQLDGWSGERWLAAGGHASFASARCGNASRWGPGAAPAEAVVAGGRPDPEALAAAPLAPGYLPAER